MKPAVLTFLAQQFSIDIEFQSFINDSKLTKVGHYHFPLFGLVPIVCLHRVKNPFEPQDSQNRVPLC